MSFDTQKDIEAKAKRIEELDGLIATAEPGEQKRHWMQEREFYRRGHSFRDWPEFYAKIQEDRLASEASAAEQSRMAAVQKAEAEARAAEMKAKIESELAAENDLVTQWKRARTTPTF